MKDGCTITGLFDGRHDDIRIPVRRMQDIGFSPYRTEGRKGVSIFSLYDTRDVDANGPAAALVHYEAGSTTPRHLHPGWELVLVLEGELIDDRGRHPPGVLQVYPPGSDHELSSDTGCTFLVVWERPVQPVVRQVAN